MIIEVIVIVGDFNADLLCDSYYSSFIRNFIYSCNLYLVTTQPTHHTENSHTLLDLCIVDFSDKVSSFSQSP
ncbi:hypothetical protein J437_LFUL010610, partial [Ladona fulva]